MDGVDLNRRRALGAAAVLAAPALLAGCGLRGASDSAPAAQPVTGLDPSSQTASFA